MSPKFLAALTLLAHLAAVSAQEWSRVVVTDFYTDVLYNPPEAWHSGSNTACATVDHYTSTVNASATVNFVGKCAVSRIGSIPRIYVPPEGDRIAIYGMNNNESGVLDVQVDDEAVYALNLWNPTVTCGLFVDYYLGGNSSHTLTLTLRSPDDVFNNTVDGVTEGHIETPVLHLTDIVCVPLPVVYHDDGLIFTSTDTGFRSPLPQSPLRHPQTGPHWRAISPRTRATRTSLPLLLGQSAASSA